MKLFSEKHTTPDGIDISFKHEQRGMWNPRVLVLYQEKVGQRRSLVESRPIPGNSREDSGEDGNPRVLVIYQEEWGSVDP